MEKKIIDYEGFEAYAKGVREKYAEKKDIPTSLSNLQEDSAHQTVTDADKTKWNKVEDKVDKVDGKQLSTNDYTNEDKTKVDNIPENPKYTDTTYDLSSYLTAKDLEGYKKADGTTVGELKAEGRVDANTIREEWFFAYSISSNTPDSQKGWYINTMNFGQDIFQIAYDAMNRDTIYFRSGTEYTNSNKYNWSAWQPILTGTYLDKLASKEDLEAIKDTLPTKLSQLTNDKNFKTESEIQSMIEKASSLKKEVVTSLPTTGKDDVIYLVKDDKGKENNNYLEYLWLNGQYELIGSTQVDLSGYMTTEDFQSEWRRVRMVMDNCSSKVSDIRDEIPPKFQPEYDPSEDDKSYVTPAYVDRQYLGKQDIQEFTQQELEEAFK